MGRYYDIEGKQYPSVTSICDLLSKPALYGFFGKHGMGKARQISKEATSIGDEVHQHINNYFLDNGNGPQSRKKEVINCIRNFHKFVDKYKIKPLLIEKIVYSKKHKYAGTLDFCSPLIDWKTSKAVYKEYGLQLEAYYRALTEMIKDGIIDIKLPRKMLVVRLDKTKEINFKKDVKEFKPNKLRFEAFLGLLKVYNWRKDKQK